MKQQKPKNKTGSILFKILKIPVVILKIILAGMYLVIWSIYIKWKKYKSKKAMAKLKKEKDNLGEN